MTQIVAHRADKVTVKSVEWLWKPFWKRAKVGSLTGDPGIGKTTMLCAAAADTSVGRPLPGQDPIAPINWWFNTAEDSESDLRQQLELQGADLSRVWITDQFYSIPRSLKDFEQFIADNKIGAVAIDSASTWFGGHVDLSDPKAGSVVNQLTPIADRTGATIILARHKRKAAEGGADIYSGLGSMTLLGTFRFESTVIQSDGIKRIQTVKWNLGSGTATGKAYQFTTDPVKGSDFGRFSWVGETALIKAGPASKHDRTILTYLLSQPEGAIYSQILKATGIPSATLTRRLPALATKSDNGQWTIAVGNA